MKAGRQPDAASLAALSAWAGLNPAEFCPKVPPQRITCPTCHGAGTVLERTAGVLVDAPSLSDERFCELWKQARDGTPDGMCGHVQVRQFGKLLYAELGITSPGPWPLGWEPKDGVNPSHETQQEKQR